MVDSRGAQIHAWAKLEVARAAVMAMARELAPVGVELLIIKGVYLNFIAAPTPGYRSVADADAVVVRGSFARATEAGADAVVSWLGEYIRAFGNDTARAGRGSHFAA